MEVTGTAPAPWGAMHSPLSRHGFLTLSFLVVATLHAAGCVGPGEEADEVGDTSLGLVAGPDLVVTEVRASSSSPVAGDVLRFSAVVKNAGTRGTPKGTSVRVAFSIDGTVVSFVNHDAVLSPGASITVTANDGPTGTADWLAPAGTFTLRARVDNLQAIAETNETNNVIATTLNVAPKVAGTHAQPADAFVDAIGVIAHLNWGNTIWDTKFAAYAPILGESGIRYVRTQANGESIPKLKTLHASYGIRSDIRIDARKADHTLDPTEIPVQLARVRDGLGAERVIGLEGPNEYSDTKYEHGNTGWATQLRGFQQELYTAAKADPALRSIPVVAPSIWKRIEADFRELGDLSASTDLGNLHYYTGGRKPTLFGNNGDVAPMDVAIDYEKINVPDAPMWVTETGYNNKVDTVDSPFSTPERTQAKYTLRLLAELFKRNASVAKAFLYNLLDDPGTPDKVYGLLRSDLSRKPVFFAVKNAIQILADEGAPFKPGSLAFTLGGDKTDVQWVVTQKRGGLSSVPLLRS
jgi:hypothetical protein